MNRKVLFAAIIVVIAGLIVAYLNSQNDRFYLQTVGKSIYKIDRKTGQVWQIINGREVLQTDVQKTKSNLSPEVKAIEFVKRSSIFSVYKTVEQYMYEWLEGQKGELNLIGWKAKKVDDQTYLVSYTIDEGQNEWGYFFEVILSVPLVRCVTADSLLEKKYGILKEKDEFSFLPHRDARRPKAK